jgi:3-deoxy-D-manno-octulosonic-acid transferase
VPLLLVSAIFRDKQFAVYNPYAPLLTRILKNFTKIFLQDTPSVNLLKKHDFSNIVLSGDTRVDRVAAIAEEGKTLPIVAEFVGNAPVFVGGSTWEADEKQILPIFSNPNFKDWRFIFAPHDISLSNINRLEKLLPEKSVRYSEIVKNTEGAILHDFFYENKNRILIIDNIGMLSTLYRYGKIAYIGGGFGSGIHNTLEPIAHGLPVLFGPKYEKFTEAVRLIETGGGFVVNKEKGVDNQHFEAIMESLLVKENYEKARDAARDYIHQNRGATEQVIEEINKIMGK